MSDEAELQQYADKLDELAKRIGAAVEGLSDAQINWEPPIHDANSVYAIATHALECTRSWVLEIVCGEPVGRDRPAEFAARGVARDIEDLARDVSVVVESALAQFPPRELDRRSTPSQEVYGEAPTREISNREALAQMVEHMALHLGQIQITRDLAISEVRE